MPEDADEIAVEAAPLRVCEYRRCGAALPPAVGRGSRARFCQDGKTWGRRALNCRDAEAVLADAESLRESDTQLDDTAVTALAGQVDRLLEPARGLVETLTTIRHQLEATTAAALAERDAAVAAADEHRRQRGLAEASAAQARETAEEAARTASVAEKERAAAFRERDQERATRRAAVEERQQAEGRLAAIRDELVRVNDRADTAAALAGERATALAGVTAELGATRSALDEERGRVQTAVSRAEAAELRSAATSERLEAAREEHSTAVSAHRAEQQAMQDSARVEVDRLRAVYDQRVSELRASQEQTVRSMYETSTALGAELRAGVARTEAAERTLARVLTVVSAAHAAGRLQLPGDVEAMIGTAPA